MRGPLTATVGLERDARARGWDGGGGCSPQSHREVGGLQRWAWGLVSSLELRPTVRAKHTPISKT